MSERPRPQPHDRLDPDAVQVLAEFTTPRRCACGHWLWPVDEIEVREFDALLRRRDDVHDLSRRSDEDAGAGAGPDTGAEVAP